MFSRDPSACAVTAAELGRELDLPVQATATAREAVVGSDIVFYNSVGLGIQDAAAIDRIITVARRIGMGRLIHL
jgi:ornithine cyclodeaminase/alanine dehydrogenase-like protein (mu-crystallin family)